MKPSGEVEPVLVLVLVLGRSVTHNEISHSEMMFLLSGGTTTTKHQIKGRNNFCFCFFRHQRKDLKVNFKMMSEISEVWKRAAGENQPKISLLVKVVRN